MIWRLECLTVALSAALLLVACSDGHGPINGTDSPEAYEKIDAPLYVYEILAERTAADSAGIDILDLLSEPRVEQLLMNHVPEELVHVQAKREAAAAFGIGSVQLASDSGEVMLAGAASGKPNWIAVVLGNLFVMGMEGLIVGIQVLRLEYYEMFGRFYRGDGKEFRPFGKRIFVFFLMKFTTFTKSRVM